jgi:hypothetical protein
MSINFKIFARKNGGQFAPESGGQFAPEWGGQLRPERGGHIDRNFQSLTPNFTLIPVNSTLTPQ